MVDVLHSKSGIGTQILLSHKFDDLLVDAGDGVLRDLVDRNYDFRRLKGVLITHEHFDHISGLYALLNFLRLLRRKEELAIVAPKPLHRVRGLLQPPLMYEPLPYSVKLVQVLNGDNLSLASFKVSAFDVEHQKGLPAVGYSISDYEDFKVVISGDTRPCKNLKMQVIGADVAVLECTFEDRHKQIAVGHMTKSEAESMGKKAKRVILIHEPPIGYFQSTIHVS